jgi:hypothetical protein
MSKLSTKNNKLYVDNKPVLKGWESYSGWYWFATELNPDGNHFGFVQGFEEEWGYFSEFELKSLPNKIWPIKKCDLPYAGRRT